MRHPQDNRISWVRSAARAAVRGAILAGALGFAAPLAVAQDAGPKLPRPSPLARVEQQVGVTKLAVEYSSPGVKGRQIFGDLVPYGQLWRTGANAATKLEASGDFTFGGKAVKAGTYALYTIPEKTAWTVILNTNAEASGTQGYDEKNDVARVTVQPATVPQRERMAFLFSNTVDDSTRLDLEWDTLRVSVPIAVATRTQVMANIEEALGEAWRPHYASARWLLENGGDLDTALGYVEKSIGIKATWSNEWVKAQILGKQGRTADAVAAAERALALGKGDTVFEGFFKEAVSKAIAGWQQTS
jgi:hypothetical protein